MPRAETPNATTTASLIILSISQDGHVNTCVCAKERYIFGTASFDQLVIDMLIGEPIPRQDQKPAKLIAKVKKTHTAHTALLIISSIRLNDENYKLCPKLTKLIITCKVPKLALIVHI